MHAPCLFSKAITNVLCVFDNVPHQFRNARLHDRIGFRLGILRTRKTQMGCRREFAHDMTVAHRALNLPHGRLLREIVLRRKPSFELVIMFTAQVVDFHAARKQYGNVIHESVGTIAKLQAESHSTVFRDHKFGVRVPAAEMYKRRAQQAPPVLSHCLNSNCCCAWSRMPGKRCAISTAFARRRAVWDSSAPASRLTFALISTTCSALAKRTRLRRLSR